MEKNKKCIIYTRVNSKEQILEDYSIESQKKYCEEYAQRLGFTQIKHMGGITESAKDFKRESYKAMLSYAFDKRNGIDAIIVYSLDRFSRHLSSAVSDIERLNKKDVILYSVLENNKAKYDLRLLLNLFFLKGKSLNGKIL